MKKFFKYLLVSSLVLGFSSCSEDEIIDGIPQQNDQLPQMATDAVVPSQVIVDGQTVNLADLQGDKVHVIDVAELINFPVDHELKITMLFANNSGMENAKHIDVSLADSESENVLKTGSVLADEWDDAFKAILGKNPKTREAFIQFEAYAVKGSAKTYLGALSDVTTVNVTPYPAAVTIEESYSIVINGGETIALNHTGDVYDNPVFTIKLDVEAPIEWAIKGAELTYAPTASETDAMVGTLAEGEGWGTMSTLGPWLLSVNMETKTYSFASAFENLYTPGDANGWNHGGSQMLFTSDYSTYQGFANLAGSFKFTSAADWNHINYGATAEAGKLSTDGGAGNLTVPETGLYWCNVNIAALTWEATLIETIGAIGSFNGWSESVALTPVDDTKLQWTGTITLSEGDEFKFRCNNDWAINLGGEDEFNLVPGGANLKAPGAGTYTITLDLSVVPYACYFE